MQSEFRQIRFGLLTPEQQQKKLQKDTEYEQAVKAISKPFYDKKHSVGVTGEEQATYDIAHKKLWSDYQSWAKSEGLYQEVTVEQQLVEAERGLTQILSRVNEVRHELAMKEIEVKEKK